jgi:hypothetical protein
MSRTIGTNFRRFSGFRINSLGAIDFSYPTPPAPQFAFPNVGIGTNHECAVSLPVYLLHEGGQIAAGIGVALVEDDINAVAHQKFDQPPTQALCASEACK